MMYRWAFPPAVLDSSPLSAISLLRVFIFTFLTDIGLLLSSLVIALSDFGTRIILSS